MESFEIVLSLILPFIDPQLANRHTERQTLSIEGSTAHAPRVPEFISRREKSAKPMNTRTIQVAAVFIKELLEEILARQVELKSLQERSWVSNKDHFRNVTELLHKLLTDLKHFDESIAETRAQMRGNFDSQTAQFTRSLETVVAGQDSALQAFKSEFQEHEKSSGEKTEAIRSIVVGHASKLVALEEDKQKKDITLGSLEELLGKKTLSAVLQELQEKQRMLEQSLVTERSQRVELEERISKRLFISFCAGAVLVFGFLYFYDQVLEIRFTLHDDMLGWLLRSGQQFSAQIKALEEMVKRKQGMPWPFAWE
jgi:hypothetical protein